MDEYKPQLKLIGESDCFLEVLEQVSQITSLNRPVLVVGERGTGKELIAERLHYLSDRWSKPLIKMNCATVSESLLESELFGHESGAFTGANKRHLGRFERAKGGTLMLDELATMSMQTQEKLLRFIEYGEFERLGGSETIKADVRLVAATNVDLPSEASKGKFRYDLLDRLAFDVISLPPLRERTRDIIVLAEHFAVSMCKELGRAFFPGFSEMARVQLLEYPWPGNIRELKNVVERCVYRIGESEEAIDNIQFDPFESPYRLTSDSGNTVEKASIHSQHENQKTSGNGVGNSFPLDLKDEVENFEKELINKALLQANHSQKKAAELLGLTYHQLRGNLKKYSISV